MNSLRTLCLTLILCLLQPVLARAQWQPLAHQPSFNASTALLLTDGTVLCQDYGASDWWKLTPDAFGSYVNGTWTQVASLPSTYAPLYYASAVLADGRVIIEGGEYNNFSLVRCNLGAIYDPILDTWTSVAPPSVGGTPWANIGDAPCSVLANGMFLLGDCKTTDTALLDPATLTWTTTGAGKADIHHEESWTLLPDGTVLTEDCANPPYTEKYAPATGTWISAGNTPVTLPSSPQIEIGPAILQPNGTVIAFGATGHSALYTPPAISTDPGTWTAGPDFPKDSSGAQLDMADAPACLLPTGHVLCAVGPGIYNTPTYFYEYDGAQFNKVADTPNAPNSVDYDGRMLLLPTGQVMYTDETGDVEIYTPGGSPDSAWAPTVTSCPSSVNPGQTYAIQGTQFNGLSQAVCYGDDASAATNYPLVRITNTATGHVVYCRTFQHSTMAVATGAAVVSTNVTVPATIELGPSVLEVVANGIPSAPCAIVVGTVPAIKSISPSRVNAGGPAFTLTVNGSGFYSNSTVNWNGSALSTTFVSTSRLTATVPAALIGTAGKAVITVATPGLGMSIKKTLTIALTTLKLIAATLTRDSITGVYTATLSLQNVGYQTAANTTVTGSSLNAASTSTLLPAKVGSIAAGSTGTVTLSYPASAGSPGARVVLKAAGAFTGGAYSGSLRVTLP